ncbi:anti-sigma factor [Corynebacterium sp. zg-331]|uniref:anti-sigma factor n=1 Tax=unclassified Corynebacterium TaxID=2624378 RepID=UPI00128AF036|nr:MULTISPECIES: anti-sigma factor [unclassified Corynebacterium]MBC3186667.1 anti-sigma factor [Corynebacterium sp. zg-331]MPV53151.1 hypothetical protein [Corynebacterium sp. zg331]
MSARPRPQGIPIPPRLEEDLAQAAEPIVPPAELKRSIMAAIASGEYPPHPAGAQQPSEEGCAGAEVVSLEQRRRGRRGYVAAAAATVLAVAGAGLLWSEVGPGGSSDTATVQAEGIVQGPAATDKMHEIMAAEDMRSVSLSADGSELAVVVSADMDSGGAMVNGAPRLEAGMGAQVWSIDRHGNARSAGVIGQEEHTDVWMPLPGDTETVRVTQEPMAGSPRPSGTVLAEGTL